MVSLVQEELNIVPQIGEQRTIQYKWGTKRIIWYQCPKCEKSRWIQLQTTKEENFTGYCEKCCRKYRSTLGWRKKKPAKFKLKNGYIYIRVYPEDEFHQMAGSNGYVFEHRLVVAKNLGRCLKRSEIIHHINGKKDDNRINNLQVTSGRKHQQITILESWIKYLEDLLIKNKISFSGNNGK